MIWLIFAICLLVFCVSWFGGLALTMGGRTEPDERHTIEIYHGCWYSTYHTRFQIWVQTAFLIGMGLSLTVLLVSGFWVG